MEREGRKGSVRCAGVGGEAEIIEEAKLGD